MQLLRTQIGNSPVLTSCRERSPYARPVLGRCEDTCEGQVPEPKRLAPRDGYLRRSDIALQVPVKKSVDFVVGGHESLPLRPHGGSLTV